MTLRVCQSVFLLPWMVMALGCAHSAVSWTPAQVEPPATVPAADPPIPLEKQAAPVQVPEAGEPATELPLTRDGAILTGLLGNRFIEVSRFDPAIEATFVDEARAIFDPRILARVSTGRAARRNVSTREALTGTGANAANSAGDEGSVQRLLTEAQRLNRTLSSLNGEGGPATSRTNSGSVEMEQFLPTGTLLFLTGSALEESNDGAGVQDAWSLGLSQPLLRGANMRANLASLRQARNATAQSEHAFRRDVMDVVRQIELGYWELVLAREVLAIREAAVALAEEQMRREEELLAVGKALRGDVITAGAERAAREADLADARAALDTATIELIHPAEQPRWDLAFAPQDQAEVVQVSLNPQESEELAMQFRPELAQARLGLANLELEVLRARNGRLPRLDVVGSYGEGRTATPGVLGSIGNDSENYSIGLEFETGLPNRAENARYRRARLENRRGQSEISAIEENIAAEVRHAIVEVNRQWQRLVATAEEVLSREESLRVVQGRREVGMATNLDVLQVERDFIEARVNDAQARVRYVQALTGLYLAEGTLLERRGITMAMVEENRDEPLGRPAYAVE
jgi:outer membrane protein